VPAHVAEQVIARCQGNPFFLLETARAWRERQDPAVPVPVPPTVLALLGEKVGTLPPGARRVLELAALLVRGTEESFLLGAAGAHPSAVAQLEQAHLIRREADGAVAVVNEPLREAVLARLTGRRRRELAGRLADRLLDMGGDDREVARLLGLAARTEEATEAWRRAAARSERSAGAHASPADLREAR
jgi:hypothetical protein